MSQTVAIHARNLTKRFGSFVAVDDVTMEVQAGEVFGFLGSNGAGKSTAIRMMCGLLSPTSGSAEILGIDVSENPDGVKRRIGYMSQKFSLYDDLTVDQNMSFFGGVYGLEESVLDERKEWAVRMADLEGKERLLTGSLPQGWKQRLALSCAVLHEPKVLFLDEPTGGVDPISRRQFWGLIDDLAGKGVTIIVTTHYLEEAERCDRLALMHAGRLITTGTVSELKNVFGTQQMWEVTTERYLEAYEKIIQSPFALETSLFGTAIHVVTERGTHPMENLKAVLESPFTVSEIVPSLEDVFIHHIEAEEAKR